MSSTLSQLTPAGDAEDTPVRARGSAVRVSLALVALALCVIGVWTLQHPYLGIVHDSTLYSLFALTRLHPDQLANDVFLRFGSQDRYTLFTPIYAAAIDLLGLEHAASLLTLVFQAALLGFAWLLGRRFMSPLAATLGVGLLVAAPGEYGSAEVFHIIEGFVTPRLPAEALAVAALVAALGQRYWLAALCVLADMSLHPLIGCAGAAMLILTFIAPTRAKLVGIAACVALVLAVAVVLAVSPLGRVDGMWLYTVRTTSGFLLLQHWSINDWSRVSVPLAVLTVGALLGAAPLLRRVCAGALVMVACGLLVTLIFADLLHVSIFISAQAWRWLWLADLVAFVLTPVIAADSWRRGLPGRAAVLLLLSAWIFRGTTPALYLLPLAIACAMVPPGWTTHSYSRGAYLGSSVLAGLALVLDLTDRFGYLEGINTTTLCSDGVIPGAVLIAAWFGLRGTESMVRVAVITVTATLACGTILYFNWQWFNAHYTSELANRFAPWRAAIPARAEVLWPDTPIGSWYLLERQSYWSPHQTAGAVFSKDKALLMEHRTENVAKATGLTARKNERHAASQAGLIPAETSHMDLPGMRRACTDPDLGYIVSWLSVAPTPYPAITIDGRKLHGKLYLYRCASLLH